MTVGEALNSVDRLTNSNDWGLIWSDAIPVLAGEVRRLMKENDELDEECTRRQLRIYEQLERVGIGDRKRPPQCHCSGLYSMICYKDRTYCTYYN